MLYFAVSVLIFAADRLLKWWVSNNIELGTVRSLIPGVVNLTFYENDGMAFSFLHGANARWFLVAASAVISVVLVVVIWRYTLGAFGRFAASLVLGGAIGNLVDRAVYGKVTDMIEFAFVNFAVFNIADLFVTAGAVLFAAHYIAASGKNLKRKPELSEPRSGRGAAGAASYIPPERPVLKVRHDSAEYLSPSKRLQQLPTVPPVGDVPKEYLLDESELSATKIVEDFQIERMVADYELPRDDGKNN
ncbi:MAG: signal peptidase II [Oscillospiraceae bacterium]|jgi:signal peptidase II|nr:signal peptidase II [Oscillospiraceae bacterium]